MRLRGERTVMNSPYLTELLMRAQAAGLVLQAKEDSILVTPKSRLPLELRAKLREHKAELSGYLRWDEAEAYALVKYALAYLAKFYLEAGSLDANTIFPREFEDRIDDAYAREDMFALRIAVREWVEAVLGAFEATRTEGWREARV